MNGATVKNRRPLKSRNTPWAKWLTVIVAKSPLTPNTISVIAIIFAAGGLGSYAWLGLAGGHPLFYLVAAVCIQLRLLCNMLDGLVAVEMGKSSPTGVLFNEAPDRLEDVLFLFGAGLACGWPAGGVHLGWFCAALALGTAYVRVLGGSLGLEQDFCGPMAKQHRMFFLTLGSLAAAVQAWMDQAPSILLFVLILIAAGSLATIGRRLFRIVALLKSKT